MSAAPKYDVVIYRDKGFVITEKIAAAVIWQRAHEISEHEWCNRRDIDTHTPAITEAGRYKIGDVITAADVIT